MDDNKFYVAVNPLVQKQHELIKKAVEGTEKKLQMCRLIYEQKILEVDLFRTQLVKLKFLQEKIEDNIKVFHPTKFRMIDEWFAQINDTSQYNTAASKIMDLSKRAHESMLEAKKLEDEYLKVCVEFDKINADPNTRKDLYAVDADKFAEMVEKFGEAAVRDYAADFIERDKPQ